MRRINSSFSSHDDLTRLCFLLDEERKQMFELAEQWKAFGTHAICTLTSQLADYQKKLSELEQQQVSLFEENRALLSQQTRRSANRQSQSPMNLSSAKRGQSIYDHLRRTKLSVRPKISARTPSDDPLEQQISVKNIFDAIRTAEVYESIGEMTHPREKQLLREFCNFIWKYLEDRSQPCSVNNRSTKPLNG